MVPTVFSVSPRYDFVRRFCERLSVRYGFVRMETIGKSVLGRDIIALRFGADTGGELYAAGVHALEYITCSLALRFAQRLCESLDTGNPMRGVDCRRAILTKPLTIVPMLNPDGAELVLGGSQTAGALQGEVERISGGDLSGWSANARGVDLNHNFDAGWHIARQLESALGINAPSPRRFGGTCPESEPETQAVVSLCKRARFGLCIALHTQGEEIYWHYGDKLPKMSSLIAHMLSASTGYALAQPETIASHAGLKDWFIEHFDRPGFTIECGRGTNPLPFSDAPGIYETIEEALTLAMIM